MTMTGTGLHERLTRQATGWFKIRVHAKYSLFLQIVCSTENPLAGLEFPAACRHGNCTK